MLLRWQALFTSHGFNFPLTVAMLQMGIICPVCYLVARPRLDRALARVVAPLALVNVFNVVCGLIGVPARCPCAWLGTRGATGGFGSAGLPRGCRRPWPV